MAAVTKTSSLDRALKAPVPHHLPKHMWQLEPTAKRNSMVAFMEQYLPQENGGTATPPQAGVRSMTASGRLPPSLLTRRPSIDKAATDVDELAKTKACLVHLAGDFEKLDLPEAEAKDGIRGKFAITDDGSMFVLNKIPVVQCSATEALDLLWDCREATVLKIWKLMVSGCKTIAEVTPRQKILHIKFTKPTMGLAGNTSARDTAVIANRYPTAIVMGSIKTSVIPEEEKYIRGDTRVLGFTVTALTDTTCSITLATEFALRGGFDGQLMKLAMRCTGVDKIAAKKVALDNNKCLKRLRTALETRHSKLDGQQHEEKDE